MKAIAFGLVAVVAAACGSPPASSAPQTKPQLRLVRCAAAIPPPQAKDDEVLRTTSHHHTGTWGMSSKRDRIVVGTRRSVNLGTIAVRSGPLSAAQVTNTLRVRDLTACLAAEPATLGKATASYRVVIGSDGVPAYVESTSTAVSMTLDNCIRRTLRATRFPASSGSTIVLVPITFETLGAVPTVPKVPATVEPWTPFAVGTTPANPAAIGAARATEAMARGKLAELDGCFVDPKVTGSLRILLEIDIAGEVAGIRPGGLGDRAVEACAAKALSGVRVMTPLQEHVEVACDFARGDAQPWRITPAAGYKVIDVDRTKLVHATETLVPGTSDPSPLPAETYVVLARGDTLGGMLQLALMWARDANAVLLAVADGRPAPLFLGMGNATGDGADDGVLRAAVRVGRKTATGCIGRTSHKASVASTTELGTMMHKLAAKCRSLHCTATLAIAIDSDAVVRDLLEVAGAARRAGFDRVLFGGTEFGCRVEPPNKPGIAEPDVAPDFE